ncbi:hypothetical protein BD414DRAFT_422044 [Trametes punicea]|nr:hypothetical protein BD414DRAFT_422044 [Trametes punicea]
MGDSWIPELEPSYLAENPYYVPPSPPRRPHDTLPDRSTVALHPRAITAAPIIDDDTMNTEAEGQPNTGSGEPSFGFPVPRDGAQTSPRCSRRPIATRNGSACETSHRRGNGQRGYYTRPTRPTFMQEIFQSITAAPELQHLSFEELRAECYAISKLTTGLPPVPVAPTDGSVSAAGMGHADGSVRCMPPSFTPVSIPSVATTERPTPDVGDDVAMSHHALNADFTFTAPLRRSA